jgi:ubiquinone/menaquinone biosynthesis C-methylase UbiE
MTVSKWLTFGHVLFSDIRHDLVPVDGTLKRESILVMDGLGNDDWSFYAAETYPAASFFNLSPRAPLPAELQNSPSSFPLSPPNHHQVQHISHADKFPFAPQSFTCFVYRFPVAAPESYYRNILTEARRVLKPGGYIELSILDVDLNNMGNHGRRTVRKLKERIREQQPDINLSSTADLIVRLLGKYGFSGIKAARVGVPVASSIARSNGSAERKEKKKDQPSLSDMMSDNSAVADENITKMVARVGRWWYTRCYENAAASEAEQKSIWSDKALMSECEELGTSLKLMVCCARAPERITSI